MAQSRIQECFDIQALRLLLPEASIIQLPKEPGSGQVQIHFFGQKGTNTTNRGKFDWNFRDKESLRGAKL